MQYRTFLIALLSTLFLIGPLQAQDAPYQAPDDSWITIDGTVASVSPRSFTLDYGDGLITVEMDDGDLDWDGYKLIAGDRVSVTGVVDDDFMEVASIEASSVYVENAGTRFYASPVDEEDHLVVVSSAVVVGDAVIEGTVTAVYDEEFLLNTGGSSIRVEVEEMPYDPLDDEGFQRIRTGDVVVVTGHVDVDLFEGGEFVAETVMKLSDY